MTQREPTPELISTNEGGEEKKDLKFMSLDDVSDSGEEDMDVSSAEDGPPPKKRLHTEESNAMSTPKWSNPDPYTVLPPVDENQGKKKDFVKLIRKARIAAAQEKADQNNAIVSNDDFISLGAEDLMMLDQAPENAPRGPRVDRDGDPALGGRKRTRNDEIISPSRRSMDKLDMRFNLDGSVIKAWRARSGQDPSPWLDPHAPPGFHLGSM